MESWFQHRAVDEAEQRKMTAIREASILLIRAIADNAPASAERMEAFARAREAVMWANLAVLKQQPVELPSDG